MSYAQVAGWIDGEGYIGIRKSYNEGLQRFDYRLVMTIANTKPEMLYKAQQILSCGNIHKTEFNDKNWADRYVLHIQGNDIIYVLKKVLPYLITKIEQAKIALEYGEKCLVPNRTLMTCERLNEMERLWLIAEELNRKGPRKYVPCKSIVLRERKTDLEWYGGLIDGEGCFCIGFDYKLRFMIGMCHEYTIRFCCKLFGAGYICPQKINHETFAQYWGLSVPGKAAAFIAKEMIDKLTIKQPQAKLAVRFWEECSVGSGNKRSEKQIELREFYRLEMKELNKRGK